MSQQKERVNHRFSLQIFPIVAAIGIVPLIVHIYSYQTGLSVFDWFPNNSETQAEFFMHWKSVVMIALGVIMIGIMLYQKVKQQDNFRFENCFYLLFFYAIFVAMSALFSSYKKWVCFGTYEMMEPVWALFAYIILCYYTYHVIRDERQLHKLFLLTAIFIVIALCIGVSQMLGCNLLDTGFAKMLILNPENWGNADRLHFEFANRVYITLYNPNFVVFYIGIILPITIYLCFASKGIIKKILSAAACIAEILCLVGASTTTGWMAVGITLLIVILVLLSRHKKSFLIGGILLVLLLIITGIIAMSSPAFQGIRDVFFGTYKADTAYGIKSIQTDDDVTIDYDGIKTHFQYTADPDQSVVIVSVLDDEGQLVMQSEASNGATWYKDANGAQYLIEALKVDDSLGIELTIDEHTWDFFQLDDGKYYYYNAAGKFVSFPDPKHVQWFNEDALSGRGHIYNKTIPVLGKHVLIGSGANTYMLEVPQDDYIYKNYTDINNVFDVKPHSWYLQQWIENGMVAMLLLVAFYMWYFVNSVRILRRVDFHDNLNKLCLAVFSGLLIYMVAAIANDSTVNVAPVYWAALGIGIAVNRMILEKEPELFHPTHVEASPDSNDAAMDQSVSLTSVNPLDTEKTPSINVAHKKTSGKKKSRRERKGK